MNEPRITLAHDVEPPTTMTVTMTYPDHKRVGGVIRLTRPDAPGQVVEFRPDPDTVGDLLQQVAAAATHRSNRR